MFNGKTIKSTKVGYSSGMVKEIEFTFTDGTNLTIDSYDDGELDFMIYDDKSKRASQIHPENMNG